MEVIFDRCGFIDVHKETLTACIMVGKGKRLKKEIRTYPAMTEDIEHLRDWFKSEGVKKVGMESTGVYWKPVYNILEEDFEIILANARHIKNVPGRNMDVKDSEWGCMLLRNGLIRGSFIPPRHIRQLRDLTRHRRKLHHTISSEKNRLQKYLEDANIKLSSVATDIFGVSGRDILRQIIKGNTNADELSDLARGTLKNKKDELTKSCRGHVTDHHRTMIEFSLKHIEYMERLIAEIDSEIEKLSQEHNLQESIELLDSIPGVDQKASEDIIAEIGTEMDQFPTEDHLSSWAGMSPGNNESAGKKKGGKTVKGNNWIKALLTQCALCASRSKGTYLKDKYFKLKSRRGAKRAAIAIGHKILISVYHILKEKIGYKELGIDYLDKRNKTKTLRYFMKKIENLGYDVLLAEKVA